MLVYLFSWFMMVSHDVQELQMTKARIDKNIPIPPPRGEPVELTASLRLMDVGDSFIVERIRRPALAMAVRREEMRNGTTFVTRQTEDKQHVRTWRTG